MDRNGTTSEDMATKANWKKFVTMAALAAGLGAAAALVVRQIRLRNPNVEAALDDMFEFCRVKAAELDSLISDVDASPAGN